MPLTRPVAVLAILESVLYGLVARLAFEGELPIAVPMTFTFIFLVPMAVGYLGVASRADDPRTGPSVPIPFASALMALTVLLAAGVKGLICAILMSPVFFVMAVLGSALATQVRKARRRKG
jgi:hypothetical protein